MYVYLLGSNYLYICIETAIPDYTLLVNERRTQSHDDQPLYENIIHMITNN